MSDENTPAKKIFPPAPEVLLPFSEAVRQHQMQQALMGLRLDPEDRLMNIFKDEAKWQNTFNELWGMLSDWGILKFIDVLLGYSSRRGLYFEISYWERNFTDAWKLLNDDERHFLAGWFMTIIVEERARNTTLDRVSPSEQDMAGYGDFDLDEMEGAPPGTPLH